MHNTAKKSNHPEQLPGLTVEETQYLLEYEPRFGWNFDAYDDSYRSIFGMWDAGRGKCPTHSRCMELRAKVDAAQKQLTVGTSATEPILVATVFAKVKNTFFS